MKEVNVVSRSGGMGSMVAQVISERMSIQSVQPIRGYEIKKIYEQYGKNDNFSKDISIENIESSKVYFIYYNYHSSSGFKTDIFYDADSFYAKINKPKGGVLCAFMHEVIIFQVDPFVEKKLMKRYLQDNELPVLKELKE